MKKFRYNFYIDGFNVYHAIDEECPQYKWLNYRKLAEQFVLIDKGDSIGKVNYFSALPFWKPESKSRHEIFIKALETVGVEYVPGFFRKRTKNCPKMDIVCTLHEEKLTDVNIALRILSDAVENKFDRAIIISSDSDLIPVVKSVRNLFPEKTVGVVLPIKRNNYDLIKASGFHRRMKRKHLYIAQFPDVVTDGKVQIQRPEEWPKPK